MNLKQIGKNTYVIENRTNIGLYLVNDQDVYIIDTGNDKDAGKKILQIIASQGWHVKGIINTHSHADHIGGNAVIQERTHCEILTHGMERCFTEYPIFEPTFLYGGFPFSKLQNKFLMAKPTVTREIQDHLPEGLSYHVCPGHSFDMICIQTDDDVYFLGDSVLDKETIGKYPYFFLYDVQAFLDTLQGSFFVPSHGKIVEDIHDLTRFHRQQIQMICDEILTICEKGMTMEEILQQMFQKHQLTMNENQYVLVGSTLRSYLSYLWNQELLTYEFIDDFMRWKRIKL